MADEKQTRLSIIIRAVDAATAKIKAINDRLDAATKPVRNLKSALADLREKSGLDNVIDGFKGVGSAIAGVLSKVALIGGVLAGAVVGLVSIINGFDELGDKAERIGVSVDFLAQMRYAAERAGASVEELDGGLQTFSKNLGQARANTGRMTAFLNKVSPALLTQLKAAKDNEAAFNLLAGAMAKLTDPAKRAALAQAALGDAALAPLFAKGPKGLKELRDRYAELAGPQGDAAKAAGEFDDSMKDLHASTDGIKAALVSGLAPALKVIVDQLREWLVGHRQDVKEWAASLGERLPAAASALVSGIRTVIDTIRPFVDEGWKLKAILVGLAAVIVGPVISAVASLSVALLTNPVGLIVAGIAGAAALLIKFWGPISGFFKDLWDGILGVFDAAWGRIKAIVDFVADAVDKFISAAGRLGGVGAIRDLIKDNPNAVAPSIDLGEQAQRAVSFNRSSDAKITIDIAGAPRGTRVKTDPQSTADVDMSLGFQMLPGSM